MKTADTLSAQQELTAIELPKPQCDSAKSLWASLWERKTTRDMRTDRLPPQVLSNVLWAAFGVSREDGPLGRAGRTAPSGLNLQGIDIYVALPDGVYLYETIPNQLTQVLAEDIRAMTNRRPQAGTAPAVLIYVADTDIEIQLPPGAQPPRGHPPGKPVTVAMNPCYGEVEAGFIGQNVYLFCASEGLAAWFYATDREALAQAIDLRSTQKVLYCQAVGYPE
jgi:nitroreductase